VFEEAEPNQPAMSWEKPKTMMMRSMEKKRSGQAGFTLVELLVVIVILGVLAGIVVFAVGGINDKGQASACKADKASVEAAEEAYYAKQITGAYYTDMAGLVGAKLLHQASTLNTITLVGTSPAFTDYTVVNIPAKCS
jgi:prepilin-type N-terminal cleavage/methylation domain-containing protein